MEPDAHGRMPISDGMKARVVQAFAIIEPEKRHAVLVISDEHGTRGLFASKVGEHWKVAGGGGWEYHEPRPYGYVAIERQW